MTRKISTSLAAAALCGLLLGGCAPYAARPTLDQVRSGNARGHVAEDAGLLQGEIAGEIDRIDRSRREIYVLTDGRRPEILEYDIQRTRVLYHGRDYAVEQLEAGDRIAFQGPPRRGAVVETIRVLEPVQARSESTIARPGGRNRADIVEGTVERVDVGLGIFEVVPRSGSAVTVSVPYNARPADVENFRALRRGDQVRVEGEFVNSESLQLLSFLSARSR